MDFSNLAGGLLSRIRFQLNYNGDVCVVNLFVYNVEILNEGLLLFFHLFFHEVVSLWHVVPEIEGFGWRSFLVDLCVEE